MSRWVVSFFFLKLLVGFPPLAFVLQTSKNWFSEEYRLWILPFCVFIQTHFSLKLPSIWIWCHVGINQHFSKMCINYYEITQYQIHRRHWSSQPLPRTLSFSFYFHCSQVMSLTSLRNGAWHLYKIINGLWQMKW